MNETTKKEILVNAGLALSTAQQLLTFLRAASPAVAAATGGPVGLGILAAVEVLLPLVNTLVKGGVITIEEQFQIKAEVDQIVAGRLFNQPQWQPRPESRV